MGQLETFQQFLVTQGAQIPVWSFFFNLIAAGVLSLVLSYIYVKYGRSLSNRRVFARNFVIITMTTMFIIVVVKSSLALSLGLVGALSIVRFRAAIKEPEELAYLFLAISIGLGMGADQQLITLTAFIAILAVIGITSAFNHKETNQNLYLTISSNNPERVSLQKIVEILKRYSTGCSLKRFDETRQILEASFLVDFTDFEQLNKGKAELKELDETLKVTFLDNKGVS